MIQYTVKAPTDHRHMAHVAVENCICFLEDIRNTCFVLTVSDTVKYHKKCRGAN